MKEIPYGRYLHQFQKGDVYKHSVKKTITESDNNLFSLLTMNHHPVHLDYHYARQEHHGRILVVGTLVFSLSVGLTVADISGKAIANLEYSYIKHAAPVFIGDTIRVESKVIEIRKSQSKPGRGVVQVRSDVYNQDNILVLTFERKVLIKEKTI